MFTPHASRLTLALGVWVFGCLGLSAGTARVAWDPSPDDHGTNLSYILYAARTPLAETNLATAAVRVNVGTNLSATAQFTNTGRWYLVATARDVSGVESEPSNMLSVEVPAPAANLRTLVVEGTLDLSRSNGWQDLGFFRLRLEP